MGPIIGAAFGVLTIGLIPSGTVGAGFARFWTEFISGIVIIVTMWVCVLVMLFATGVASANTPTSETRSELSRPERIGSAELNWFGINLYKAELFTETGGAFAWGSLFRLDLTYSRDFSTSALVKATLIEMDRLEGPRADHPEIGVELGRCFQDVRRVDVFSAIALE